MMILKGAFKFLAGSAFNYMHQSALNKGRKYLRNMLICFLVRPKNLLYTTLICLCKKYVDVARRLLA